MNRLIKVLFVLSLSASCLGAMPADYEEFKKERQRHIEASNMLFQSGDPARQEKGFGILEAEYNAGSAFSGGKLGWAYQKGLGVEANLDKALELYLFAAKEGMTYWQYLLAHAYQMGYLGFNTDDERSIYWLNYEPKVHLDKYECWVAYYYEKDFFPMNRVVYQSNKALCEKS